MKFPITILWLLLVPIVLIFIKEAIKHINNYRPNTDGQEDPTKEGSRQEVNTQGGAVLERNMIEKDEWVTTCS